MRPVDADYLIEECHWVIRSDGTRVFVCHVEDIENAPTIIDNTPVTNMKPIVHGHWLHSLNECYWNEWICSECGFHKITDTHVSLGFNYCPNCGAKMDGKE